VSEDSFFLALDQLWDSRQLRKGWVSVQANNYLTQMYTMKPKKTAKTRKNIEFITFTLRYLKPSCILIFLMKYNLFLGLSLIIIFLRFTLLQVDSIDYDGCNGHSVRHRWLQSLPLLATNSTKVQRRAKHMYVRAYIVEVQEYLR